MTPSQKTVLESLLAGPARIPIVHFGKLRDLGYVEKADLMGIGQRGYAPAAITAAGRKAVAA